MDRNLAVHSCSGLKPDGVKVMTQGSVFLSGEPITVVEVHRGMLLTSVEGQAAGRLAAVAVSQGSGQVVCLILSRLPHGEGYQSLPAAWIAGMEGEVIYLNVSLEEIRALPDWHLT